MIKKKNTKEMDKKKLVYLNLQKIETEFWKIQVIKIIKNHNKEQKLENQQEV